jgi:hypothetical protein
MTPCWASISQASPVDTDPALQVLRRPDYPTDFSYKPIQESAMHQSLFATKACSSPLPIARQRGHGVTRKLALAAASFLLASVAGAQTGVPNTFIDWPVPNLTRWSDVNALTVEGIEDLQAILGGRSALHAQRSADTDGVTFIYPDEATRDADVDGDGTGSVAFISWELDDGSGRAPGIQAITDDFLFPTNNCIMASGERESLEFPGTIVPKTCSDDEGSSKRYFLEITAADVPIDLVFETGLKDIRYKGIKNFDQDGGESFQAFREEFGIGRIYRVLKKFINQTDERIVSIRVELGHGVGDEFTPFDFETDGVAFEMRPQVPRSFFEGSTGAPPIATFNPLRFATSSPKLFDDGLRPRFDPGFFDDNAAGFIPPQSFTADPTQEKSQFIDGGSILDSDSGRYGSLTLNYFDMNANQAAGADPAIPGSPFGYMLPESLAPTVIARHDDGDASSESDAIVAWWDGFNWRYGLEGDEGFEIEPYGIVPEAQLQQWASLLLGQNIPGSPTVERYESLLSDDLSGMNADVYIYIGENMLVDPDQPELGLKFDDITLRLVLNTAEGLGLPADIPGTEEPDWAQPGNEAPPLEDYMPENTPVAINDLATTLRDEPVTINVLANDLLNGVLVDPEDATVARVLAPSNGIAELNPLTKSFDYTPNEGFVGEDVFTYIFLVDIEGQLIASNEATVRVIVNRPPGPPVPVANNDFVRTFANEPVMIDVLANDTLNDDPIPEGATITIVDPPLTAIIGGTAEVDAVNNLVIYTPPSGYIGFDAFTYRVSVDGEDSNAALVGIQIDEPTPVEDPIFHDRFEALPDR